MAGVGGGGTPPGSVCRGRERPEQEDLTASEGEAQATPMCSSEREVQRPRTTMGEAWAPVKEISAYITKLVHREAWAGGVVQSRIHPRMRDQGGTDPAAQAWSEPEFMGARGQPLLQPSRRGSGREKPQGPSTAATLGGGVQAPPRRPGRLRQANAGAITKLSQIGRPSKRGDGWPSQRGEVPVRVLGEAGAIAGGIGSKTIVLLSLYPMCQTRGTQKQRRVQGDG